MTSAPDPQPRIPRGRDAGETKRRLLDAAVRLFADRGFSGTSMRAVTQAAGVSVSAANYHFGSKEALLQATFGRVIEPVNQRRVELLDALDAKAGADGPTLRQVLDAFLRPVIESRDHAEPGRDRFRQLAARLFSDPPAVVAALKEQHFGPISERMVVALGRALPGRTPADLELVFQFAVGMMVHVIAGQLEIGRRPGAAAPPDDDEELLSRMVSFAEAGILAASGEGVTK
jgi:AcrR family transcriptional regulator